MKNGVSTLLRPVFSLLLAAIASVALLQPATAQMREQMKEKIVDDVADQMVSQIQSDSCPQFAQMMQSKKSGGSSKSGKASGMMKSDPAMRERFVNKVAGPLLNKMIDCDMLPNH